MRVVAFAQGKGGTSKSCSAINLACQATAKAPAAVIDMDAEQGTSLKWHKRRNGKVQPVVRRADVSTLDEVLETLKADGIQWAFLDLPGRAAAVTSAGIRSADLMIVPCRPLDVDIESSLTTVQAATTIHKPYVYLMSIAPSQHDRKRAKQVQSFLRAHGHRVADTIIVQRIIVPDAIAQGLGVNEANPGSDSDKEFAELFAWLNQEVRV